ncbi:MAG TPA: hypothetical protein VE954_34230 [Oligoflexus sp.]|uniref:hypothetical protein n=1 Tax=Oligoflexus sp. TaxID=1971216 RepID=UPI002D3AB0BE|nr:hypothetical protein [Oligoflexus sp.]HYX38187.1 hypothetical protein [Oligoflexus sp.]
MRIKSLKALGLMVLLSSPAAATTFEFVAENNEVIPVLWNYREVATRKVVGCRQWDVLQGTGWFQATWYTDYTPKADNTLYTVEPKPTLGARICAARMDAYNSVRVEAGALRGSFSVNPDGLSNETTITCRPNPAGTEYDNLVCDEAHVALSAQGTVRIVIRYED